MNVVFSWASLSALSLGVDYFAIYEWEIKAGKAYTRSVGFRLNFGFLLFSIELYYYYKEFKNNTSKALMSSERADIDTIH